MSEIVWTIAGSDSGGGAGIQADLKAMHSFGVHGCSVVTALTAQNSVAVEAINSVSNEVLESQILALAKDMPAKVIKIGMLATVAQVELVAEHLRYAKRTWAVPPVVVYDPVAIASSGERLTEEDTIAALKQHLLPVVDVITPNTQETQLLTGVYLIGPSAVREAAAKLHAFGISQVVIKGGHWDYPKGYCIDYASCGDEAFWLGSASIQTPHSHGTGCSFASALAACLAKDYPLKDAFILAKAYINQGLKAAVRIGEGFGPVAHLGFPYDLDDYPQVIEGGSWLGDELDLPCPHPERLAAGFASIDDELGLYAVVDSVAWVEKCLAAGVKTVQLRIKDADAANLATDIQTAIAHGKLYGGRVFINDHWQLAIKHGAYGIHLGQEDLAEADLAAIQQAGICLGVSTHGFYEMLRAHQYKPSYLAFGAIYPTTTKDMTGQIQGLNKLQHFVPLMAEHYPTVAIGGINLERATAVAATGVGSVAVVRAITEAEDYRVAIAQLQQAIGSL
ncbi:thiamine phosphate synthase [Pseudoalteromonas fenneropenaei]|uniref:Thiamine-phosphate synthase n=1 Tax=Pseudoalteromonas fenneropenaei TaxID=1737459 RepID=A0ABV7CNK6_9GAMM